MITVTEARELWDKVWDTLADHQAAIIQVIETKAWEPLGYESFADAWLATQRSEITMAQELRPYVIYQLLSEGLTVDEVSDIVKGVGAETVDKLNKQRKKGVPPGESSTKVRPYSRTTRPHTLHIYVGAEKMEEFHRIVAEKNLPSTAVLTLALEAIEKRFRKLDSE